MADPLSPMSPSHANRNAPATFERSTAYTSPAKRAYRSQDNENQAPSSPFVEDPSPVKLQSTIKSRSPKKEMQNYSPRRLTEDALRENEGLTSAMDNHAIDPTLGRPSPQKIQTRDEDTVSTMAGGAGGFAGMDDTCFSAFSAVPNADMTRFANIGQSPIKASSRSPTKHLDEAGPTPRPASRNTPSRNRRQYNDDEYASPTPRRHKSNREDGGDTTNLLVDFTDQFNAVTHTTHRSPTRNGRLSPTKTTGDLSGYGSSRRTPSPTKYPLPPGTPNEARHLANLLDFDLPPAPTPRSIPSISARELESMKSHFLSQVSSLTATLSGKEAEVRSLKDAVTDAERRAGEAQEQIRDERSAKETLQNEKQDWEQRQGEMQAVLKDVKEEIIRGDREKDALLQRVHEAEHKREEAESRVVEAESQIEGLQAASTPAGRTGDGNINTNSDVEAAVTKVAKELHGLYKSKHEAKVTALKKSYSDRWEKKVRDLTTRIEDLTKENEDLRVGRDATMSTVIPALTNTTNNNSQTSPPGPSPQQAQQQKDLTLKLTALQSELTILQTTLTTLTAENNHLKTHLAASRAEIADLISASEELLLLSAANSTATTSTSRPPSTEPPPPLLHSQTEGLTQKSFSRSFSGSGSGSGLQRPGFSSGGVGGESRIGRMGMGVGGRERNGSGSGSGLGLGGGMGRSGILSNIERMGRGREGRE